MMYGHRILQGPAKAYPAPSTIEDFAFHLAIIRLDQNGGVKAGDHARSNTQSFPLLYDKESVEAMDDCDECIFAGNQSPFIHPKLYINLNAHDTGMRIVVSCSNDNEQLQGQLIFRSEFTRETFKTLMTEGLDESGTTLTVPGDCPMFNAGSDEMTLTLTLAKHRFQTVVQKVTLRIKEKLFDAWEHRCKV